MNHLELELLYRSFVYVSVTHRWKLMEPCLHCLCVHY